MPGAISRPESMLGLGWMILLLATPGSHARATITTNGYENVLVAISPQVVPTITTLP